LEETRPSYVPSFIVLFVEQRQTPRDFHIVTNLLNCAVLTTYK